VETLKADMERLESTSGDIGKANTLTNEIRSLESQLESLEKQYSRAEEDFYDEVNEIIENYRDKYYTALENYEEYKEQQMTSAPEDGSTDGGTADEPVTPHWDVYDENNNLIPASVTANEQSYLEAIYEAEMALRAAQDWNVDEIETLKKAYDRSEEDLSEQIYDLERKISDAYEKLDVIGLPEVDDVINYATDYDLAEAKRKYDEANASLTEVTAKYEAAKTKVESLRKQNTADGMVSEYTILLNTYQAELDSLEAQLKQKNKDLEAARKELSGAETPADPEDIRKQIEEA
jgi:flagellar biosynthesis chaperone FliJ